jgi:hypothetical protein
LRTDFGAKSIKQPFLDLIIDYCPYNTPSLLERSIFILEMFDSNRTWPVSVVFSRAASILLGLLFRTTLCRQQLLADIEALAGDSGHVTQAQLEVYLCCIIPQPSFQKQIC